MNAAVLLAAGGGFAVGALFLLHQSSKEHRHLREWVTASSGAISAVLAGISTRPQSTGLPVADIVLAAVFAGVVGAAAVRARRNALVGCTLALAIACLFAKTGSSGEALAVGAISGIPFGASLATRFYPQRERFLQAAIAPLVALTTLNLPTSLPSRGPSILAGVVACVLFVSAYRATMRRNRIVIRRIGLAGVVVTGILGLLGVLALSNARTYAEQAVTTAKSGLVAAEKLDSDTAESDLKRASANLQRARSAVRVPWSLPARAIPILGRNLVAVDEIADGVGDIASQSSRVVNATNVSRFRPVNGSIDTNALVALRADVASIRGPLTKTRKVQAEIASDPWIASALSSRLGGFTTELNKLDRDLESLNNALTHLPAILGDGGTTRRYLLVVVSPAEARGSGGVMGNFGELTAQNGRLTLTRFGRSAELTTGGLPIQQRFLDAPADYIARYAAFGANTLWSNMNMGPDFRAVGTAMANHYPQSGGSKVNGVISVDPIALQALLRILGPINVDAWDEPLDGTNTAEVLLFRAYVDKGGSTPERLELLSQVAQGVWGKITNSALPGPESLGAELGPVVRGRHLQMWMRDPAEQKYISSLSADGAVPDVDGDNFGVVVNNASANKIEWFLSRTVRYDATVNFVTGETSSVATVTLRNDAPKTGLPEYIIGNQVSDITVGVGDSRMYVSMYSPLQLQTVTVDGVTLDHDVQTELGRNVYSSWVVISAGKSIVLTYTMKGTVPIRANRYYVDIWSQPLIRPDKVTVSINSVDQKRPKSPKAFLLDRTTRVAATAAPLDNVS